MPFNNSVIVGAESSTFSRRLSEVQKQEDDIEETMAFSENLLAEKMTKYVLTLSLIFWLLSLYVQDMLLPPLFCCRTPKEKNKKRAHDDDDLPTDEDVVEDLILSRDEE
jgi:nucleolar complex protein 2